jgi:hypothetical protein
MDNFLADNQNMEVSTEQINNSATGAGAAGGPVVPTVIPLKRKLDRSAIVKHTGSAADSNNAGNSDEATENKRRKSSRTSTSGTVCDFMTIYFVFTC